MIDPGLTFRSRYIMFELLLNSFRATLRHARKLSRPPADFPIHIHIVSSSTHITIRLSDHAGGIRPAFIPSLTDEDDFPPSVSRRELFSFSHLDEGPLPLKGLIKNGGLAGTVGEQVGDEKSGGALIEGDDVVEARLRIGLPLSAIFAQFFGTSCPGREYFICVHRLPRLVYIGPLHQYQGGRSVCIQSKDRPTPSSASLN